MTASPVTPFIPTSKPTTEIQEAVRTVAGLTFRDLHCVSTADLSEAFAAVASSLFANGYSADELVVALHMAIADAD